MKENILHIKNMVCQRCILTVRDILTKHDLPFWNIELGKVELARALSPEETQNLSSAFSEVGFELIQERNQKLINKVKSVIIREIYSDNPTQQNLSEILSKELYYDYSHITNIFSEITGKSIKKFYNEMRIERVKELLEYDELSISMIADRMGYSTPAYLSTSFKQFTGYTPSEFKNFKNIKRSSLDSL